MSDQNKKPSDNRSATQRIQDLENAVMSLFNVNDNLARDVMTLKEAIKLLDNKVNSIVKASTAGEPLTDAVLTRIMVENNVAELAQKVTNMVSQGFLQAEDQVSENAFVVGSEHSEDGTVINPRLQFALKAVTPETQAKLLGMKVGDTLKNQEGKMNFKLLESYKIVIPQEAAPAAPAAPALQVVPDATAEVTTAVAEAVVEQAPEAPAAEAEVSQPDQPVAAAESK